MMILQNISSWINKVVRKMFNSKTTVESSIGSEVAVSTEMQNAITTWLNMYQNNVPWLDKNPQTLGLPATISAEIAKMVTLEMKVNITGEGERAKYIEAQFEPVMENIRRNVEYACAGGGIAFKPYVDDLEEKTIAVDVNLANMFFPISFNSRNKITSAVFIERKTEGKQHFTRMELHKYAKRVLTVENKAFKSISQDDIGTRISLAEVPEWSHLSEEPVLIENVKGVLFSYFKVPFGNTIDPTSPLGVSVYSRAVSLIKDADMQYQRLMWEYEGGELAIDASTDVFPIVDGKPQVPVGKERLFRPNELDPSKTSGDHLIKTFSPELRNDDIYFGLNKILMKIEDKCGLARGTLSEITDLPRTATETKQLKQRTYTTVSDIQLSLKRALEHCIEAIDVYATLYDLCPAGKYEVTFYFDDAIGLDTNVEKASDRLDVSDGVMAKWEYRMKWYGEDETTAKAIVAGMESGYTDDEILGLKEPEPKPKE